MTTPVHPETAEGAQGRVGHPEIIAALRDVPLTCEQVADRIGADPRDVLLRLGALVRSRLLVRSEPTYAVSGGRSIDPRNAWRNGDVAHNAGQIWQRRDPFGHMPRWVSLTRQRDGILFTDEQMEAATLLARYFEGGLLLPVVSS